MRILVINCGSSSLKYDLIDLNTDRSLIKGQVSRIGLDDSDHTCRRQGQQFKAAVAAPSHSAALQIVLATLVDPDKGSISSLDRMDAVAHRVAHGGTRYRNPVLIDADVIEEIRRLIPLLPLHHQPQLAGIEACRKLMPEAAQVAVFDTAFHRTIPDEAAIYGLPFELFQEKGIRKFGFHGNSHEYVSMAASHYLETPRRRLNMVTCHLGSGASICAIQKGRSIDTSMGFSPLDGLIMGTRCGSVDVGILPYLMHNEGMGIDDIDRMLHRESGLLGISGISSDMREILSAADQGDARALLAVKAFCYRVKTCIGAYSAAMDGADVLIFTGGIGQNSRGIRSRCTQGLERFGLAIDRVRNDRVRVDRNDPVFEISAPYSRISVLVIATNEERMIASHAARVLNYTKKAAQMVVTMDSRPIRVAVSAHHLHLCERDVEALFGPGHKLTPKAPLYIDSQFACEETVTLIGPRGRIERVRVLGPARSKTQVEISRTEEFKLGIDAPVRASGDLKGSPGLVLQGPGGRVELPEGVICAMRHIHMTPKDAEDFGVNNGDKVMVRMGGERELVFGDVLVRVNESYKLEMHIDTDEANAADLPQVTEGYLVMVQ
jgi:acetate kinase